MSPRLFMTLFAVLTATACTPLQTKTETDNGELSSANSSTRSSDSSRPSQTETRLRGVEARLDRLERQLEGLGSLDLVEQVQSLQQETRNLRGNLEQNSHRLENFQPGNQPKVDIAKIPTSPTLEAPLNFPALSANIPANVDVPSSEATVNLTQPVAPAVSQFEIPDAPIVVAPNTNKPSIAPAVTAEVDNAAASLGFGAPAPVPAPLSLPNEVVVSEPAPARPPAAITASNLQENGRYQQAFDLLKNGRYGDSITAFEGFLAKFPQGEYAGNAQYWLGEAHYVTRAFDAAVSEFSKVIDNYPNSPKYADSLLKLGYVHYELKQWQKARARLTQVIKKTPGSTVAKLAQQRLDRIRREGH